MNKGFSCYTTTRQTSQKKTLLPCIGCCLLSRSFIASQAQTEKNSPVWWNRKSNCQRAQDCPKIKNYLSHLELEYQKISVYSSGEKIELTGGVGGKWITTLLHTAQWFSPFLFSRRGVCMFEVIVLLPNQQPDGNVRSVEDGRGFLIYYRYENKKAGFTNGELQFRPVRVQVCCVEHCCIPTTRKPTMGYSIFMPSTDNTTSR